MRKTEELLKRLQQVDKRAAVRGACLCAISVLDFVPERESLFRNTLEAAIAWTEGKSSAERCRFLASEVRSAADFFSDNGAHNHKIASMCSLYWAILSCTSDANDVVSAATDAATAFADSSPETSWERDDGSWAAARKAHLEVLYAIIRSEPWPMSIPTSDQLHGASHAIQVAWDSVAGQDSDFTIAALVTAHERAERLELDWTDPVQRAIAERAIDETWLSTLLDRPGVVRCSNKLMTS